MQNSENQDWSLDRVTAELRRKMINAVDAVVDQFRKMASRSGMEAESDVKYEPDNVPQDGPGDLRTAALVLAIRRVADVTLQRGIWP